MAKHCLAKNNKEIPPSFTPAHRAAIERNRIKFKDMVKAGTATAISVCTICPPATPKYPPAWDNEVVDDDYINMLSCP